jgi:hypothetical protein
MIPGRNFDFCCLECTLFWLKKFVLPNDPPTQPSHSAQHMIFCDRGMEFENEWTVAIDETGEIWTFRNSEVRAQPNRTFGRK